MISSSRHFTPIVALLLCCVATVASGQDTKVLVIGGTPKADVVRSFGVVPAAQGEEANNSDKLNAAALEAPTYPWYVPTSSSGSQSIFLSRTLVLPATSGRRITGGGLTTTGGSGLSQHGSRFILRAERSTVSTVFDGTTRTASTSGAGDTITLVGRDVHATDLWNSVEITGGTNFVPGWYGIVDVDTDNNTWQLDRDCTTGGSGAAMEGYYCPTMIRNHGYGTVHEGLVLQGIHLNDDRAGSICYHIPTSSQAGASQGAKHTFDHVVLRGWEVGVLLGHSMARAYEDATDWQSKGTPHADHLTTRRTWFHDVRTCFYHRSDQSVGHNHIAVRALNSETVFYFDAGGKMSATGINLSGGGHGRANRILYLGRAMAPNGNPFLVQNFSYDGGANTRNPQLLKARGRESVVTFRSGIVNPPDLTQGRTRDYPLCDVHGGHTVLLEMIYQLVVGEDNALLGTTYYDANNDVTFTPHFIIRNCKWGGLSRTDPDPTDVVHADCDAGVVFDFQGNSNARNTTLYWDGRYVTDGAGGGTWVSGGPPDE